MTATYHLAARSNPPATRILASIRFVFATVLAGSVIASQAFATQFVTMVADPVSDSGHSTSVAIDSTGAPLIAHARYSSDSNVIRLTTKIGSQWVPDLVDKDFIAHGGFVSLKIDSTNTRHLVYYAAGGRQFRYASRGTGTWTKEFDVDHQTITTGHMSALALDESGNPHASYVDDHGNLRYAIRTGGTWQFETADTSVYLAAEAATAIAIDRSGRPHIVYPSESSGEFRYATKQGGSWESIPLEPYHDGFPFVGIALDEADVPQLAYSAGTTGSGQLHFARRSGVTWTIETVSDPSSDTGYDVSIALTSKGEARISYRDNKNKALKYASRIGSGWNVETVDGDGDAGYSSSVVLDADDLPRISYAKLANGRQLWFADVVRLDSVEVTSSSPLSIPAGSTLQLMAEAKYTDSSAHDVSDSAAWVSSNDSVATVSTSGLATGHAEGTADMTATFGRLSGRKTLTVTAAVPTALEVTPADTTVEAGDSAAFHAFGIFGDQSRVEQSSGIAWSSDDASVATVTQTGLATGVGSGSAHIIARSAALALSDSAVIRVPAESTLVALSVTPENPWRRAGLIRQFSASGHFDNGSDVNLTGMVNWSSSVPSVAVISPSGAATAVAPGLTVIRATSGVLSDSTILTVRAVHETTTISMPANHYRAVSFPLSPDDPNVFAVLDELGPSNPKVWRFWRWSPRDAGYFEAGAGFTKVIAGEGYWLITKDVTDVHATGTAPDSAVSIDLFDDPAGDPTWTFFANPFPKLVLTSDIMVSDGTRMIALTDTANHLTQQVVKGGDSPPFIDAASLQVGLGYWIKKVERGTVELIIFPPPPGSASLAQRQDTAAPAGTDEETPPRWTVRVTARQGERVSDTVDAGVADVSPGAWSSRDRALPPSPPGEFLRLASHESAWGPLSGAYTTAFRAPDEPAAWDLTLTGAGAPGEIEIAVSAEGLPEGATVVLDDGRGTRWLAPASALDAGGRVFTLAAIAGPMSLRLSVRDAGAEEPTAPSLAPGFAGAYPNPFRDATGFRFRVDALTELSAGIYDASGRLVRAIGAVTAPPGEHVLVWDGRDGSGRPLAAGVYLARWQAGATKGSSRIVLLR